MSTWPFRSAALALCSSALLAGCAFGPHGVDERVGAAANELAAGGITDVGVDADGCPADLGDDPGDANDPEPLPWRDHRIAAPSAAPRDDSGAIRQYEPPDPEPLPWEPDQAPVKVESGTHQDSDGTR